MARCSSHGVDTRYVLPVLGITWCFHTVYPNRPERNIQNFFIDSNQILLNDKHVGLYIRIGDKVCHLYTLYDFIVCRNSPISTYLTWFGAPVGVWLLSNFSEIFGGRKLQSPWPIVRCCLRDILSSRFDTIPRRVTDRQTDRQRDTRIYRHRTTANTAPV